MQVSFLLPLVPFQTSRGGPRGTPISHPQAKQAEKEPEGEAGEEHAWLGQSRPVVAGGEDKGADIFMVVPPGSCWQEIHCQLHGASLPSSAHGNMLKLQAINGHK